MRRGDAPRGVKKISRKEGRAQPDLCSRGVDPERGPHPDLKEMRHYGR